MTSLGATQQLLWSLITAPEGVAAAVATAARRGSDLGGQLAQTVCGDGPLDAVQRLDIYANMYFFRLLDVVKDAYPATAAVTGAAGFHNVMTDYLLAHPPAHYSVRYAGAQLPEFLGTHAVATAHPVLPELARFERALADAFDADDAPSLDGAVLAGIPPAVWGSLRLVLHPSVRLQRARWPVHVIRERVDAGEPPVTPGRAEVHLCVWRDGLEVRYRTLAAAEWRALEALGEGRDFATACSDAAENLDNDVAAAMLVRALASWLRMGLVTEIAPVS